MPLDIVALSLSACSLFLMWKIVAHNSPHAAHACLWGARAQQNNSIIEQNSKVEYLVGLGK